jgi:hypothetical protein
MAQHSINTEGGEADPGYTLSIHNVNVIAGGKNQDQSFLKRKRAFSISFHFAYNVRTGPGGFPGRQSFFILYTFINRSIWL